MAWHTVILLGLVGILGAVVLGIVLGVVLLRRRASRLAAAPIPGRTEAGAALTRADTALRAGLDELAYAVAQFGTDRTRDAAAALEAARGDLDRAFSFQHRLEDAVPDSERQQREWTREMRTLADRVQAAATTVTAEFAAMRRSESDAPARIAQLRRELAAARTRRDAVAATFATVAARYPAASTADAAGNPGTASGRLDAASAALDAADADLAASAVPNVGARLDDATAGIREATRLLDAVERRGDELDAAHRELTTLREAHAATLADARALRDAPPDPDSGAAVNAALGAVEAALAVATAPGPRDPIADLDAAVDAVERLDLAVAAARNEARRLDGARSALGGALVSARTQLAAVEDLIASRGGGADARGRLRQGRQELVAAENEADPVAALDAARRAQTFARDADALARWR